MSIPQLPGVNPAAAYPLPAIAPQAQQQLAYFGRVHFGSVEESDNVDLSTDKPADTEQPEQQDGNQQAEVTTKSKAKKVLTKLALAAACAGAGMVFPPAFLGAAVFGLLALVDLLKGRKADATDSEGIPAEEETAEPQSASQTGDDAEVDAPEEPATVAGTPAEEADLPAEVAAETEVPECRVFGHSEETIKLSDVRNLIEDEGLRDKVKTADVARVISDVLAEQYDNVEPVNPRATNKQIDTALAQAAVDYIGEHPEQFTAA